MLSCPAIAAERQAHGAAAVAAADLQPLLTRAATTRTRQSVLCRAAAAVVQHEQPALPSLHVKAANDHVVPTVTVSAVAAVAAAVTVDGTVQQQNHRQAMARYRMCSNAYSMFSHVHGIFSYFFVFS